MSSPTYETFITRPGRDPKRDALSECLESLGPGDFKMLPVPWRDANAKSMSHRFRETAKRLGVKFAIRTIDGKVWVCRLKPEDVKEQARA